MLPGGYSGLLLKQWTKKALSTASRLHHGVWHPINSATQTLLADSDLALSSRSPIGLTDSLLSIKRRGVSTRSAGFLRRRDNHPPDREHVPVAQEHFQKNEYGLRQTRGDLLQPILQLVRKYNQHLFDNLRCAANSLPDHDPVICDSSSLHGS
jgi:hypothetical protein